MYKSDYYIYGDKPPKLDGYVSPDNLNIEKDLSVQIDGIIDTFDVGESFINLRVYYNSTLQNSKILSTTATTFTLDFIPRIDSEIYVFYDRDV